MIHWDTLIPPTVGTLPGGLPLRRTDPAGPCPADVAFLGVYPALTKQRRFKVDGTWMNLPVEVEAYSFDPASSSGAKVDEHYLAPLGLTRADVFIFDLVPYFLANVSVAASGRSMDDNVRAYERSTGIQTGIVRRPEGDAFLDLVRDMPGNLDRLRDYLGRCKPRLLFTLGTEPAAFLRGLTFPDAAARVDSLLYAAPVTLDVLDHEVQVVHLAHPRHFGKTPNKWTQAHEAWCQGTGRRLGAAIRSPGALALTGVNP